MKQGSVLVDREIDGYRPLGAFGQPVHNSYVQLHAAVKQRLGERCANVFARPQWDERNRRIRWISPIPGEATSWPELTPEEQAERSLDLKILQAEFAGYLRDLRAADTQKGSEAFASVLDQALKTPNDKHLHFIGDQPVMTFWGFSEVNGEPFEPLSLAPAVEKAQPKPSAIPPSSPTAAPTGEDALIRRFPAWLLWIIPLLLLLFLLSMWLFFWEDPAKVPATYTDPPTNELEEHGDDRLNLPLDEEALRGAPDHEYRYVGRGGTYDLRDLGVDGQGRVIDGDGNVIEDLTPAELEALKGQLPDDPSGETGTADMPGASGTDESQTDETNGDAGAPEIEEQAPPGNDPSETGSNAPEEAPAEETAPPTPEPDATEPEPSEPDSGPESPEAEAPVPDSNAPQEPPEAGAPLEMPPETDSGGSSEQAQTDSGNNSEAARQSGSVDFMRGKWQSRSDITDQEGNQLDQTYEFDSKGQGRSMVRRSDGIECSAPAHARRQGDKLTISELEDLTCSDGRRYQKSETECVRDNDGKTRCSGGGFDVQIERPK